MQKRYGTDFDEGLRIWRKYSRRFFENSGRLEVFVFDYNRFCREPLGTFAELLDWLGRPVDPEVLRGNIASFWSAPTSTPASDSGPDALPEEIRELYADLSARAGTHTAGSP
jgi:hypothetical protein